MTKGIAMTEHTDIARPLVGFYACMDTLVRCSYPAQSRHERPPTYALVDCPACGHRHGVGNFLWRKAASRTEFDLAEVRMERGDD